MLTDIPATASERDIIRSIPTRPRPFQVELGQLSYDTDIHTANAQIKSKLLAVGPLEWWEDASEAGGKRAKARARFESQDDARQAVEQLNQSPVPFNTGAKLTLQLVHSARLKVSEQIYDKVKEQIETANRTWKSQYLTFLAYDPARGYRVVKIEGEDSKAVASAKNALEKILAGKLVVDEGKALWIPSFGMNGDAYRRIVEISKTFGVAIVRSRRQSRLHVYGSASKCEEAQQQLVDLAKENSSSGRAISLDQEQFVWRAGAGSRPSRRPSGRPRWHSTSSRYPSEF